MILCYLIIFIFSNNKYSRFRIFENVLQINCSVKCILVMLKQNNNLHHILTIIKKCFFLISILIKILKSKVYTLFSIINT